jgi:hypothetical protein
VSFTGLEPYRTALLCRWAWHTFTACGFLVTKYVYFQDSSGESHWVDVGIVLSFNGVEEDDLEDAVASIPRGILRNTRGIEWSIDTALPMSNRFAALGIPKEAFYALTLDGRNMVVFE